MTVTPTVASATVARPKSQNMKSPSLSLRNQAVTPGTSGPGARRRVRHIVCGSVPVAWAGPAARARHSHEPESGVTSRGRRRRPGHSVFLTRPTAPVAVTQRLRVRLRDSDCKLVRAGGQARAARAGADSDSAGAVRTHANLESLVRLGA